MIRPTDSGPGDRVFRFDIGGGVRVRLHPMTVTASALDRRIGEAWSSKGQRTELDEGSVKVTFTGPDEFHIFVTTAAPGDFWTHPRIQEELKGILRAVGRPVLTVDDLRGVPIE